MLNRARFEQNHSKLILMLYICVYFGSNARESVFSTRPFKQRPTNSSQPLCFGRKTRRSQSVKFESVVLESQGQPAAVGRQGGAAYYYLDSW